MTPESTIHFFIPGICGVKGNSKKLVRWGRRWGIKGRDKDIAAEASLHARSMQFRPSSPWRGPVRLDVEFILEIPSSWAKWKRAAASIGAIYPTTGKDRGNMLKLLEDALAEVYYENDAQVVAGDVRKTYGDTPGYSVTLTKIEQAVKPERKTKP